MGVGERHEQGRHKWISVRQNSLSYTLSKKVSIISIIKLIKSWFYRHFFKKVYNFHDTICSFFYILSYFYGLWSYDIKFLYQFSVQHHLKSNTRTLKPTNQLSRLLGKASRVCLSTLASEFLTPENLSQNFWDTEWIDQTFFCILQREGLITSSIRHF